MKFHEKQWLDLAKTSNETNSFRRRNKSPDVHIRAFWKLWKNKAIIYFDAKNAQLKYHTL